MSKDNTVFVASYSLGFGEVGRLGPLGTRDRDIDRLCRRVQGKGSEVLFVYEAGTSGYGLQRYRRMARKGKHANVVVTCVARELARFIWDIGRITSAQSVSPHMQSRHRAPNHSLKNLQSKRRLEKISKREIQIMKEEKPTKRPVRELTTEVI